MSTADSTRNAVLVVGAGPVGLTMAAELARHGVRCRLIDRAPKPLPFCRAIGVTPRTLEVWEDMGVARAMIDRGLWLTGMRSIIAGQPAQDLIAPPLPLPFAQLGLPQYETERVLAGHLVSFGVEAERGCELISLKQDGDGVAVAIRKADGTTETAQYDYVVGCDGAHSAVRKAAGIGFEGEAYPWPFMLGDVHITWDLAYGMAFRSVRPVEGGPPDMFIAIPLPEPGRYRVSMLAPQALAPPGGTDHGIQTEAKGPTLADLQGIADDLLPGKPRLSDLRWSSIFRISMRLASRYRSGRVFIAGDAAHIHPPTGGQGMNTGIQDAYNLAWKLALILRGTGSATLLDSYEAERRPVGADVVARTRAASEKYGSERGKAPDRLVDTQVLVSYRGTPFVGDENPEMAGPAAGDRAPDVAGLRRNGLGFPLRLFDILRGTDHVLIVQFPADADRAGKTGSTGTDGSGHAGEIGDIESLARGLHRDWGALVRVVAISAGLRADAPLLTTLHDPVGRFAQAYGSDARAILVRPDGHIGWRGATSRGLEAYLERVFTDGRQGLRTA